MSVNVNGRMRLALIAAALATPGCAEVSQVAEAPGVGPPDAEVRVYFYEGCPKYVDKWTVEVDLAPPQRVKWIAYTLDGSARLKDVAYDIYFNPFVGPANAEKGDGIVRSLPVFHKTPTGVDYKYSIVAGSCQVLDPFIRVR